MSDKKKVAHNLGKWRYVFDRAKNYIQSVLYFVQFGMQVATVLALYNVGMFWLATMAAGVVVCIGLFIWFMRFDIAHNLPAEHGWVWSINPKYQELRAENLLLSDQMAELQRQIKSVIEMISSVKNLPDIPALLRYQEGTIKVISRSIKFSPRESIQDETIKANLINDMCGKILESCEFSRERDGVGIETCTLRLTVLEKEQSYDDERIKNKIANCDLISSVQDGRMSLKDAATIVGARKK